MSEKWARHYRHDGDLILETAEGWRLRISELDKGSLHVKLYATHPEAAVGVRRWDWFDISDCELNGWLGGWGRVEDRTLRLAERMVRRWRRRQQHGEVSLIDRVAARLGRTP